MFWILLVEKIMVSCGSSYRIKFATEYVICYYILELQKNNVVKLQTLCAYLLKIPIKN